MKKQTKLFEILSVKRGNNSYYGNPSYYLGLADENNNIYYAKTASNAAISYEIGTHWIGSQKALRYHCTRSRSFCFIYYNTPNTQEHEKQPHKARNKARQEKHQAKP